MATITSYLDTVEPVIAEVVEPAAADVDRDGTFPRTAVQALGRAGLLGLVSAAGAGGMGEGPRAAAEVVQRIARCCGSTAMVITMHYCGAAVIEQHGPRAVREAIARGEHLTTLAFSEVGSRGHFWAPLSTARRQGDRIHLDARKSFATSAGEVDSYVWSSRPAEAEGMSTLWLVPAETPGLEVGPRFDGLGLRGNASTSVTARDAVIPAAGRLGEDGAGFDVMMGTVLPLFQVLIAAVSVGIMEAITAKTANHAAAARYEHLGQTAADMPVTRHHVARMRIATDQAHALLLDTLSAIESGREDTMLRVLSVKAAAAEAATAVADLGMRVCGGSAFRREVGVERHFRDARAATVMAPTTDVLYDFVGRVACGLPLFEA
ncbi:MAG TPA: acyl-CoA dehydrogenase family protein [Candidatus Dormibacteraeota bacterium]|jgi:alkylation response protein AidB-like acyl-CoA dehydrogenase|nr:acyl-CoA dehydrogenase family protein [Candidatus Dormibacteraeota bacterium]